MAEEDEKVSYQLPQPPVQVNGVFDYSHSNFHAFLTTND